MSKALPLRPSLWFERGSALLAALALGACAHAPKSSTPVTPLRLATLKVDSAKHPEVAAALSSALRAAKLPGVTERIDSHVSLEVVQLSIECADATPECQAAAGRELHADRMLLGQVVKPPKGYAVRMVVSLFDVASARTLATGERSFKHSDEAVRGAKPLVDWVLSEVGEVGE